MLFRLHTHLCVNNSFSFSKSLRKQVRKSVESKTEWRALGSPHYDPASHQEPQFLPEIQEGPCWQRRHFLCCKGLLGNSHLYTMGGRSLFCTNMVLDVRSEVWLLAQVGLKLSSKCLHSQRSLISKICTLVSGCSFSLPPLGIIFLKKHPWN